VSFSYNYFTWNIQLLESYDVKMHLGAKGVAWSLTVTVDKYFYIIHLNW
jgi:hypothetical protein